MEKIVVVGSGLAGLTAVHELTSAGREVILLDQESEQNLGGQAYWSFGGLFFVNSPQQRRMGIKDSRELALQDWMGTAAFDRREDYWPRKWAEAYVDFASGEKYDYVRKLGMSFVPLVGWAERGDGSASGHGNSVPRFHVTWGTGTGVIQPFVDKAHIARNQGLLDMRFRHRVTQICVDEQGVCGVKGAILEAANEPRGVATSRQSTGDFFIEARHVVIASGGIGGNYQLVKKNWPVQRLGPPPESMICGVPAYVDGHMLMACEEAGAALINRDRMWHYCEGIRNFAPIWPNHAIRILPGPSSVWLDAFGNRFPPPYMPGFDTMGTFKHILSTGQNYSWFILNQYIIKKEFALSGSEQNPDITNRSVRQLLKRIGSKRATEPVEAFKEKGEDFLVAPTLETLVKNMNALAGNDYLPFEKVKRVLEERDRQLGNKFCKDTQITLIRSHRKYLGDKLLRVAPPHKILDPRKGPLIAVRLNLLTRKTLGGLETNLNAQVLRPNGEVFKGLYAVGEAAGFGGGGMHGYRALEGTFLGGCIFSGIKAGRYLAGLKDD